MATPQTPNLQIPLEARQTVLDKVVAGDSFTAYEITLEVRRRLGQLVDVPHAIVNNVVQTMFAGGEIVGYDREPDKNFAVPNPPFRYFQGGGRVTAPFLVPVAPALDRTKLPSALQFVHPIGGMVRSYGVAARDFHREAGTPYEPFAVWLPTQSDPVFRLRCYGSQFDQSDIEECFALDISAPFDDDRVWKAAYAYVDEFRIILRRQGVQTTFRAALDVNLVGSVSKETEQPTSEADGVEIEIAARPRDFDIFGRWATHLYRYFRVLPRVHNLPASLNLEPPRVMFEGNNWRIIDEQSPLHSAGDFALVPLDGQQLLHRVGDTGIELQLDAKEVDLLVTGEAISHSPRTQAALQVVLEQLNTELAAQIETLIESAPDLWEAKSLYHQALSVLKNYAPIFKSRTAGRIHWQDITIENEHFGIIDNAQVTIFKTEREILPAPRLRTRKVDFVTAQDNAAVFFNDLNTQTGSPARLREFFARTPNVQVAYVLTFVSNAARDKFVRDNHFESVPTRDLSSLPKPASPPRNPKRQSSRTAFKALIQRVNTLIRRVQAPRNPLVASFETLDEADFVRLKNWAREVPLDGPNWAEVKRFYKVLELRLWPLQTRSRWKKSEADLPPTALPAEREMELLGILMGRLDACGARRGGATIAPSNGGPSEDTLAYMVRRARYLLVFLRDRDDLSDERRAMLAPLFCGLLQRDKCDSLATTLPFRLGLEENEVVVNRPGWSARLWSDASLALPILRWAFDWLQVHGIEAQPTPAHVRRFIEAGDANGNIEFALQILPTVLESGMPWDAAFDLKALAQALQGDTPAAEAQNTAFLDRRIQIVTLFARFPQLQATDKWLRLSLSEANQEAILNWATPWVKRQAEAGDFKLAPLLSLPLAEIFNAALVESHPQGLSPGEWQSILPFSLALTLSPALQKMPLSSEAASLLWSAEENARAPWIEAIGEDKFNAAFTPALTEHAQKLDFAFVAGLSPVQSEIFFGAMARAFPNGLKRETWTALGQVAPMSGWELLPLGAGFWTFWLGLDTATRALWLGRLNSDSAARDFAAQPAATFGLLLDKDEDDNTCEFLGTAWLDTHLSQLAPDDDLVLRLVRSGSEVWSRRALAHLQSQPLLLPAALRLIESELPLLQQVARPFFQTDSPDWSERVLALADSPNAQARRLALDLLARFTERWTPPLLQMLAQHDDPQVQAFVAVGLLGAPHVAPSQAVATFDRTILNARGQSRRAKTSVQVRLIHEGEMDIETLLEAARSGAPRDRAWALQKLALAALEGADVGALKVGGAVARARRR